MPAGALGNRPAREIVEEEAHAEPSKGFFSRVADVGRVLSSRATRTEVAERIQVVQKPVIQPEKSQAIHAEEDQYLDIPAFLRRQAN